MKILAKFFKKKMNKKFIKLLRIIENFGKIKKDYVKKLKKTNVILNYQFGDKYTKWSSYLGLLIINL